jgi:hypothetical protein
VFAEALLLKGEREREQGDWRRREGDCTRRERCRMGDGGRRQEGEQNRWAVREGRWMDDG